MLLLSLFAVPAVALELPKPQPGDEHYDLELLYHQHEFDKGLKLAKQKQAADPSDKDLYWHIVRFMFEIGERYDRNDKSIDKVAWYNEMVDWSKKGLAVAPNDPHLLFGLGISMGRLGTTRGVLASLFLADDVENAWLTTANSGFRYSSLGGEELLPCHVYESLGIFYRLVPESWIVQAIGGTRGDLKKSVEWNLKAYECAPQSIAILKELGASEVCYGQRYDDEASIRAGMAHWSRATTLTPSLPTDHIDLEHVATLMAEPGLACGYSRDGQQETDASKLEAETAGRGR